MRTSRALLAAVAAIAGGAGAARRRRALAGVAPEFRRPALYVPMSLRGDLSLRVGRRLIAAMPTLPMAEGVMRRVEQVGPEDDGVGVRVVVYEHAGRPRQAGALLWMHGGGLVMGTPEQGDQLCSRFAAELGIVVISVDYRLAPEHPFPAALDDCARALQWLHREAGAMGIDPAKVAVGGDSAGGGLAACLAQLAHDRGGLPICFQLLQYPMLDDRTALHTDQQAIVWTNTSNRYSWAAYLGHPVTEIESRPYAAAARHDHLHGLPPAWIGVGDIDLFHDECVEYCAHLRAADVPCELHVVPGMYHGAEQVAPEAPAMEDFLARMVAALGAAVTAPGREAGEGSTIQ